MSTDFFQSPILNSPYEVPNAYWELDKDGQPTGEQKKGRRPSSNLTPVPKPRKRKKGGGLDSLEQSGLSKEMVQQELIGGADISTAEQRYDVNESINAVRALVAEWRQLPNPDQWMVTPETARLLQYWRHFDFPNIKPFFCQLEAVETAIFLAEVAPKLNQRSKALLEYLRAANQQATTEGNPELFRIALKLATGAGKTMVMAMLIAWQTINHVRRPNSKRFSKAFLIVAPGITIKDRLRVLQPHDPNDYYSHRELVPHDLLRELQRARIVITNYHAFKLRDKMSLPAGSRALLQGRGPELNTLESEGEMIQRVAPELMGERNIIAINDEAHHCYREKPVPEADPKLKGDERKEALKNTEAARLWISGLEAMQRKLGIGTVFDLSATPFFLAGSGYVEGTLFPWTACDFSLMDAIESGIVKLPRVPVSDNVTGETAPVFRNLWDHIGKKLPKTGRKKGDTKPAHPLPPALETALEALYGHYDKTDEVWRKAGIEEPPVFIIVCNNTTTSKLLFDHVAGWHQPTKDRGDIFHKSRFDLFSNHDEHGNEVARPRTLLIDSAQLESGEGIDANFREANAEEIEQFRREISQRDGAEAARTVTDEDILREVMNTVGQRGKLGGDIRCVVSVSMLTEGWDASTVTHILGVRAFGTQLLCEQVVGRALRRRSYQLNEEGRFDVEYADVLGVPFDFASKPVIVDPKPPKPITRVFAVSPERDALEMRYPRVTGYRTELPDTQLRAEFNEDSTLVLTPEDVGPTKTDMSGLIGEVDQLGIEHLDDPRRSQIAFAIAARLVNVHYTDEEGVAQPHLFNQFKSIARQWMRSHLVLKGGTNLGLLLHNTNCDLACRKIAAAIHRAEGDEGGTSAVLDPHAPEGSTLPVNFTTSKQTLWKIEPHKTGTKSHLNWIVLDGDWEGEFCRLVEQHPRVYRYVKNHSLGFEVPYLLGSLPKIYRPDFLVDVSRRPLEIGATPTPEDLVHLVVEIKGQRKEDAKAKAETMTTFWVPGVNRLRSFGEWAFVELTDVAEMETEFAEFLERLVGAKT